MRRARGACSYICAVLLGLTGCGDGGDEGGIPAPTDLVAMPIQTSLVQLSWSDNADGEDGFRIYRDAGSGFVELDTTPADHIGYSDATVTDGDYYTYYVVAFVASAESASSNESTVEAGPPYLEILTPTDGDVLTVGDTCDITWHTNMPDFDAEIWLSIDGGATWPPQYQLETSWLGGPPWSWQVGYGIDYSGSGSWEQVITSTNTQCRLFIKHYAAAGVSAWSVGTFTVTVP